MASTILALGLAWSNVEAPEAQASLELPYVVSSLLPEALLTTGESLTAEAALRQPVQTSQCKGCRPRGFLLLAATQSHRGKQQ